MATRKNGERSDESLATYPGTGVLQMRPLGWNDLGQIPLECFGIDPEAPEHDIDPNFHERYWIELDQFCEEDMDRGEEDERPLEAYLEAGERLAEMLALWLDEPGVPAVIAAYLEDRMDGVVREFCRGDEATQMVACEFLEKLYYCLSRQEGRDCWPEVPEKTEEKFLEVCRRRLTPLHRRFGISLCGEVRLNRLLAA